MQKQKIKDPLMDILIITQWNDWKSHQQLLILISGIVWLLWHIFPCGSVSVFPAAVCIRRAVKSHQSDPLSSERQTDAVRDEPVDMVERLAAEETDTSIGRWRRPKTELTETECWTQTDSMGCPCGSVSAGWVQRQMFAEITESTPLSAFLKKTGQSVFFKENTEGKIQISWALFQYYYLSSLHLINGRYD